MRRLDIRHLTEYLFCLVSELFDFNFSNFVSTRLSRPSDVTIYFYLYLTSAHE